MNVNIKKHKPLSMINDDDDSITDRDNDSDNYDYHNDIVADKEQHSKRKAKFEWAGSFISTSVCF